MNTLLAETHHFLLHIYDNRSGKYFLVDTGSALSIIPPNKSDLKRTYNQHLIAANGTPIKTFGTRLMILTLGLQKYTWRFIIADVTQPIIGGDFLRSHCLLVDLANERLIRSDNLKRSKAHALHMSHSKLQQLHQQTSSPDS